MSRIGSWMSDLFGGRRKARGVGIGAAAALAARPAGAAATISTVNSLQSLLLDIITGVGVCFVAYGALSFAISLQSHDDSQRSKAIMSLVGGCLAVSVRLVLDTLGIAHQ